MKSKSSWLLIVLCCVVTAPAASRAEKLQRFEFQQIEMGVPFRITLYACEQGTANKAADDAFQRIRALNQLCSDYDSSSDLLTLCREAQPGSPYPVKPELAALLQTAASLNERTEGSFDVTVGPLVKLWRRARRQHQFPDEQRIREARAVVGQRYVLVGTDTVTLDRPGMRLDLGGIAKGYATDEALHVLSRHGIPRALIDGGGDIRVGDPPPGQLGWEIRIAAFNDSSDLEQPESKDSRQASQTIRLANAAVATSGDLYQFVELDGVRYSHIIDPRTGKPCTTRSAVTVIAPNGTLADSLASALSVLGPDAGLNVLSRNFPGTDARIVVERKGTVEEFTSSRFNNYTIDSLTRSAD